MYLTIDSANSKLVGRPRQGICAALTLPIAQTCPPACPVKDECYAQGGRVRLKVARLERESGAMTPVQIAKAAACEIEDSARKGWAEGRPLRLFEAGDARTTAAAKIIAGAARTWLRRGGLAVWGYTHAWRKVPRSAWSGVSIFASVESVKDAQAAIAQGYVPAIVIPEFPSAKTFERGGIRFIPCPAQTTDGRVPCVRCRLCFDDEARAVTGTAIAFAAHGQRAGALRRRLPVMRDANPPTVSMRRARQDDRSDRCFVPTKACGGIRWGGT